MPGLLDGRRILLTRPAGRADGLAALLRRHGADVGNLPLQAIEAAGDDASHARLLQEHRDAAAWVFTSIHAVERAARLDPDPWPPQFAIGAATGRALQALRRGAVHWPEHGQTSEDLLAHPAWPEVSGRIVLLCTGEGGRGFLDTELRRRGATVTRADLYRRRPVSHDAAAVRGALAGTDTLVCTSGEGLQHLERLLPPGPRPALLVVPSARVLELARPLGYAEIRVPQRFDDAGWIECLATPPRTGAPFAPLSP